MGEGKLSAKVGSHSSMAVKVIGNLKGIVEEEYKGMEPEPFLLVRSGKCCVYVLSMCLGVDGKSQPSLN